MDRNAPAKLFLLRSSKNCITLSLRSSILHIYSNVIWLHTKAVLYSSFSFYIWIKAAISFRLECLLLWLLSGKSVGTQTNKHCEILISQRKKFLAILAHFHNGHCQPETYQVIDLSSSSTKCFSCTTLLQISSKLARLQRLEFCFCLFALSSAAVCDHVSERIH